MRMLRTVIYFIFASCAVLAVVSDRSAVVRAEVRSGDWTISKSDIPGKVGFSLIEHHHGGMSSHESDWPASLFPGVDFSKSGRQDVHFTISRDAGKIDCEGFLNDGEGAGVFHFQPDPDYVRQMKDLGFSIDEEKQFSMAIQDVSVAFAREMKDQHLTNLDADKLTAFRIFGVDSAFIQALRTEGLKVTDSDKLVAFRIHVVTPEMVRVLHQSGYSPDEDTLIAMRIHGATPEWIAQLKQRGYDHVELEKLIAFRIHGVSPEFIEKLQGLGYRHPEPDDLIAMRIHNVTPEYISDLRARGMRDLSIDQLVSMRIHGID
ncbi:MAG TPA: hypothetical protein VKV39_09440 [Candidatus Sulfotelmatobacter sp.]|nr:hypothetical protein [Candidatus Sulfotelmatobacter sp.]